MGQYSPSGAHQLIDPCVRVDKVRHVFNSILKNNEFAPKINEFYS